MDHDERRRRRAVRGAARVAARGQPASCSRRRAAVRLQRLACVRGLQPTPATATHPGQALRARAWRHPACAAALGLPARWSRFLRAPVPGRAYLLQLARRKGAQVRAALLAREQRRV